MSERNESSCCGGTILLADTQKCGCAEDDSKVIILIGCGCKDNSGKAGEQTTNCCGDS